MGLPRKKKKTLGSTFKAGKIQITRAELAPLQLQLWLWSRRPFTWNFLQRWFSKLSLYEIIAPKVEHLPCPWTGTERNSWNSLWPQQSVPTTDATERQDIPVFYPQKTELLPDLAGFCSQETQWSFQNNGSVHEDPETDFSEAVTRVGSSVMRL